MVNYTYTQNDITFPNVAITKNKQESETQNTKYNICTHGLCGNNPFANAQR